MKLNKIFLASLLLLAIFALGAVSASDNATDDSMSIDDSIQESLSEETGDIMQSDEDDAQLSGANDSGMKVNFVTQDSDNRRYPIDEKSDLLADSYGHDYIRVKFHEKVTGNLSLKIDNKIMGKKKVTSMTHFFFANSLEYNLTNGAHSWEITYSGDGNYAPTSAKGTFNLNLKNESGMNVTVVKQDDDDNIFIIDENRDIYINDHDSDYLRIKFTHWVTGKLSLYIDGKFKADKNITTRTHYFFVNTKSYKLTEGNHTWKIRYTGDDNYKAKVLNGTFTLNPPSESFTPKNPRMTVYIVSKDDTGFISSIDAEGEIGTNTIGNDFFKVKFTKQVSGNLSLYIDGKFKADKKITKKTHYLYVNIESYNLKAGRHTWEVRYSGDDEHRSESQNGTFNLNENVKVIKPKIVTKLTLKSKTFNTKTKTKKYTATIITNKQPVKKAYVYLTIKGKKFKKTFKAKTNKNGVATFKITGLTKKGTYTGTVTLKGTQKYNRVTNKITIKVYKKKCNFIVKKKNVYNTTKAIVKVTRATPLDGIIEGDEGYELLNQFRAEKEVWQLNKDNKTKTYFNKEGCVYLKPLEIDPVLENVAKIRAMEQVERFGHTRPDNSSWDTIYPTAKEGYNKRGENAAKWQKDWKEVTEAWKETAETLWINQGHRRNMLNPDFNCVGMAGYKINGKCYWVQAFGYIKTI